MWNAADDEAAPLIGNSMGKSIRRSYVGPTDPRYEAAKGSPWSEKGWADSKGRKYLALEIVEDVSCQLQRTEMFKEWPCTPLWIDDVQQKLAPFRFSLVSIDPTIVLMQAHDYGAREGRSKSDVVGPSSPDSLHMDGLENWLFVGTHLPATSEIWCFAPALNKEPKRLVLSSVQTEIPGTKITITRAAEALEIAASP